MRKAVLIIHGLAGGTYDVENVAWYLELNRCFDIYTFTLPGHDVRDISKTKKEEWINSAKEHVEYLIKHHYRTIYIVGHSMGGVIAAYLATKYKQVKRVVLAAPSFSHIEKEEGGVVKALLRSQDVISAYGVEEFLTRLNKLPFTAVNEFKSLVDQYQDVYKALKIPVMFVHGSNDQIVPIESSKKIYSSLKVKKKYVQVNDYYHDIFKGDKIDLINKEIKDFLKKPKIFIKSEIKEI